MKWVTKKYKYENDSRRDKIWIEKRFAWRPISVDDNNSVVWLGSYYALCRLIIGGTKVVAHGSSAKRLIDFWDKVQEAHKLRTTSGMLYSGNPYSSNPFSSGISGHTASLLGISDLTMIPYDYDFEKDLDNLLDSK